MHMILFTALGKNSNLKYGIRHLLPWCMSPFFFFCLVLCAELLQVWNIFYKMKNFVLKSLKSTFTSIFCKNWPVGLQAFISFFCLSLSRGTCTSSRCLNDAGVLRQLQERCESDNGVGGQTLVRGWWSCTFCNRDINSNWSLKLHVKVGMFLAKREREYFAFQMHQRESMGLSCQLSFNSWKCLTYQAVAIWTASSVYLCCWLCNAQLLLLVSLAFSFTM